VTDLSLARPREAHLLPAAVMLAVLLHAVVVMGLWWLAPFKPDPSKEEPIMVLFDSSPSNVGLQIPERIGPPPESTAASLPPSAEPQQEPRQQALAPSEPPATPEPAPTLPLFEFSVPPPPEPPPPPTSRDFPKTPAPNRLRPVQRTPPLPAPPGPPAQQRPPIDAPAAMPAPYPGPQPADSLAGPGRQRNDYLSRVFRHLEPYRVSAHSARAANQQGRVVTRVTLARNGGLIDVSIDSSSGRPNLDAAELAAIRAAAPFPPLPANMPGDPVILILRMTY
jgi:protein TonB